MRTLIAVGLAITLAATSARASFEGKLRPYDFDGDGNADLLFVGVPSTPGDRLLRVVLGGPAGAPVRTAIFRTAGGSLRLADAGDVDGDGRDDLVMQGLPLGPSRGVIRIDLTDGAVVVGNRYLPDGSDTWTVLGVADTNGDGAQEILSETGPSSGSVRIQRSLPGGTSEQGFLPTAGGAWQLFGAADLNADGREDLVFEGVDRTPAAGHLRIDFMATTGLSAATRSFVASGDSTIDLRGVATGLVVLEPARSGPGYRQFLRFDATGVVPGLRIFHFGWNSFGSAPFAENELFDFGAGNVDFDGSGDWITSARTREIESGEELERGGASAPTCASPSFGGDPSWRTFAVADLDGDGTLDRAQSGPPGTNASGYLRLLFHNHVGNSNCEWSRVVLGNGGGAWAPFLPSR